MKTLSNFAVAVSVALPLVIGISVAAFANSGLQSLSYELQIPPKDRPALEKRIQAALEARTGVQSFRNFVVDWTPDSVRCVPAESEMDPDAEMGVCAVKVSAFQLDAQVAIIKTVTGYSISVIYANVE